MFFNQKKKYGFNLNYELSNKFIFEDLEPNENHTILFDHVGYLFVFPFL